MESREAKQLSLIRWVILSASAAVALGYFRLVDVPFLESRLALHNSILNGSAPSPYRYRVLVPGVVEVLRRAVSAFAPERTAFLAAYATYDLASVFLLLSLLFTWFRIWFSRAMAFAGVFFVAAVLPVALADHYFQPWSLLEAALFTAGLIAIRRRQHLWFGALVLLAALNKETGLLLPLAYLAVAGVRGGEGKDDRPARGLLLSGAYAILWAGVFMALRLGLGSAPQSPGPGELLSRNLSRLSVARTLINVTLFLGIFWVFAVRGLRLAPAFLRRSSLVVPPYLLAVAVWGLWYEVRLLMPLYAIAVPLGLCYLAGGEDGERVREPSRPPHG